MPGCLPRLTRRGEFLKVAGRGRKAARPGLVLQALPQPEGALRVGFTATRKIGNAVARNRAKRRLREAARLLLGAAPPPGWDLVLIARDGTAARAWPKLLGDLRGALHQAGVPVDRTSGSPAVPSPGPSFGPSLGPVPPSSPASSLGPPAGPSRGAPAAVSDGPSVEASSGAPIGEHAGTPAEAGR